MSIGRSIRGSLLQKYLRKVTFPGFLEPKKGQGKKVDIQIML